MHGVKTVVSDDHAGLEAVLPGPTWERCQFHLLQNTMAYAPRST